MNSALQLPAIRRYLTVAVTPAALIAAGTIGAALAQVSTHDIDLADLRERSTEQAGEADALAATARSRAKAVASTAAETAASARANRSHRADPSAPTAGPFDFDRIVIDAGNMAREDLGEGPRFIAFASTSLPPASLATMLRDVPRAGGIVVFRGLAQGSGKVMTAALVKVLPIGGSNPGIGIDPRLFRAFAIEAVPTYVVVSSNFSPCDGFDCTTQVPPYDRVSGNVTAAFALATIAAGNGPGARIARAHLARLEPQP